MSDMSIGNSAGDYVDRCSICNAFIYNGLYNVAGRDLCESCRQDVCKHYKDNDLRKKMKQFVDYEEGSEEPCLWDSMPETYPGSGVKIGQLSCPCPKCNPRY